MPINEVVLRNIVEDESYDIFNSPVVHNKFQKMYAAAVASLMWAVAMGMATGYSAPASYDMKHRHHPPTSSEVSWISSILALGAMVGGLFGGLLADKYGRKTILIMNITTFITGWLMISFSVSINTIIIGRFISGISCGIVSVIVPMYCVEISTSEVRGLLGSSFQGFVVIGNLLSAVVGSLVSWQDLALVGAGTSVIALICFVWMPESPRWFLMKGEMVQAQQSMADLIGNRINIQEECERIYSEIKTEPKGFLKPKECKQPTFYKPAILTISLMFFQQFSGANSVLFFSSTIFEYAKNFLNPKTSTIILGVIQVIATLLSSSLVDKVGRKVLLLISSGLMTLSHVALGIYFYESSKSSEFQESMSWMPLFCFCTFIIAFSIGYGPLPWLLAAEMVPLRARSTVIGLATFSNGMFAFIVTKTFTQLEDIASNYGAFWTYGCVTFFSCFFSFLLPETKGKKLEEITKLFSRSEKEFDNSSVFSIYQSSKSF